MTIGVVGTGRMGRALAHAMAAIDEPVLLAPGRPGSVAEAPDGCRVAGLDDIWLHADLVILALPFPAALGLMSGVPGRIGVGRTLVDVTNPSFSPSNRSVEHLSGGELIARNAPTWHVAKAFNTIPAGLLCATRLGGLPVSVPVAGDQPAKADVFALARRLRFEPLDAGGIADSGTLESLAVLLRRIGHAQGLGAHIAIRIGEPDRALTAPLNGARP